MDNLYIFIDESGNFDFSPKGTRHLVMCGYTTKIPWENSKLLQKVKYELLTNGVNQEYFHATEDLQTVRNIVFDLIKNKSDGVFDIVFVDKQSVKEKSCDKKHIYTLLVRTLLNNILIRFSKENKNKVIVVIDQTLTRREQGYLKQTIKSGLKNFNANFNLYFFSTKSDYNSQIADYGSWSIYVNLERNESRPIKEIGGLIKTIFDLKI